VKTGIFAFLIGCLLAGATTAEAGVISYSVAVLNPAAPSPFNFAFSTPITPVLGFADYSFSSSITLTDGGLDGVSAAVGPLPEFWQLQIGDAGSVFTFLDDIGGTGSLVGAGPFNFSASGTIDCSVLSGGCAYLKLNIGFLLSGGGDQLSSSGTFDLSPHQSVPEPLTLSLFGAGLAGAVASRRRKKNKLA
jgi:hypothetical protein